MPDWIDHEYDYRKRHGGRGNAFTQSDHAALNARYPGLTIQVCEICGEPTGKADGGPTGRCEDHPEEDEES